MKLPFDLHTLPLVVARAPAFPVRLALDVLAAPDPLAAAAAVFASDPAARSALRDASPSLAQAVDDWIEGKPLRNAKTPLRALAYLLRMCARPTPLGLCSGVGVVPVGDVTTLRLDDESAWRTSTRPDMKLLLQLAASLERSEFRGAIRYVANDCVVERGERLFVTSVALASRRFAEGMMSAKQRAVTLKNTEAVAFVRKLCATPRALAEIAEELAGRFAAPIPDALRLLDQLVSSGLLISELVPSPLGDPAGYLLERFEELRAPFAGELRDAVDAVADLDRKPVFERTPQDYAAAHARFAALSPEPQSTPLQTDLGVRFTGSLGAGVLADVERFAGYAARVGRVTTLERLHQAFLERYEGTERMVPLLELVDENLGIAIPEKLSPRERDTSARDALLFALASDAQRTLAEEIVLDEAALATIAPPLEAGENLLSSMEIGFAVDAADARAVDAGEYSIVPCGYRFSDTANKSLGRFARLFDEETRERMRSIARRDVTPGTVCAEFAFAPREERAYNVVARPQLRDHELRVGIGQPGTAGVLTPADLWIGIEDEKFFLWSRSRNCRVDLRETHTFATAFQAPDLCRLLAYLRYDGTRALDDFDWGPAAGCTYLPRVRTGRLVLSLRRWRFETAGFDLERDRTRWRLPRFVYLTEEDRRLLLDLDSPVASALIADQCAQLTQVELVEALPHPGRHWVSGRRGAHAVEFIAQGLRTEAPAAAPAAPPSIVDRRTVHGPGSAWTYAKLYCGKQTATHVLQTRVAPLLAELRARGAVDRWFFVRYGDPHFHVRLRLRAAPGCEGDVRERVAAAAETWLQEGAVARVATDTYSPEYERYGGPDAIEAAEAFFTADSDGALALLARGPLATNDLVARAAASFDAYLRSERLVRLALEALAGLAKQKLPASDRDVLKTLQPLDADAAAAASFERALEGGDPGKRLCDLVHMHCNRIGIDNEAEGRVYGLLRAMALRRAALKREREPECSGSRS